MILARKQTNAAQGWQAILAHPLFATIVPMWFAATFALSTLAVRGALIEQLVLASQIDLILPMATPPLGMTARLSLATVFGLGGGLLGWLAVRLMVPGTVRRPATRAVADPRPTPPDHTSIRLREADAHPDAPARRPIWAHEELGAQSFDSPLNPRALPVRRDAYEATRPAATPIMPAPAPLVPPPHTADIASEPAAPKPMTLSPGFPTAPANGPSAADHIARAPLESLSHIELIERLAIAMQRHHAATGGGESAADRAGSGTADALRAALAGLREVK